MKTYCFDCLKKRKEPLNPCPSCNALGTDKELDDAQIRNVVQRLHKKVNVARERISAGLSSLVIGITLVIIGIIFFRLASKLDQSNTEEIVFVLVPSSAEFIVSMFGLIVGGVAAIFGLVWSIFWNFSRRVIYHDVAEIRETRTLTVSRTPTSFEILWQKISYFFRQTAYRIRRAQKEKALGEKAD